VTPNLKAHTLRLWKRKWSNLPLIFTVSYRIVCPHILQFPWFHNIPIFRKVIVSFSATTTSQPTHSIYLLMILPSVLGMLILLYTILPISSLIVQTFSLNVSFSPISVLPLIFLLPSHIFSNSLMYSLFPSLTSSSQKALYFNYVYYLILLF
jgi:hypothetical protein